MNMSNLTGMAKPTLNDFYSRFSSSLDNPTKGHGAYKLAQTHLFNINIFFSPFFSNVALALAANTIDPTAQSFRLLVRSINIPDILLTDLGSSGEDGSNSDANFLRTEFGYGLIGSTAVLPETNVLSIDIASTEFSVHEHAFYYWLNEIDSQKWVYADRPFTKATIIITQNRQQDLLPGPIYIIAGAFPKSIEMPKFDAASSNKTDRKIDFYFSKLCIIPNIVDAAATLLDAVT